MQQAQLSSSASAGPSANANLYAEAASGIVALYCQRTEWLDHRSNAAPGRKNAIDQQLRMAGLPVRKRMIVRRVIRRDINEAAQRRPVREIDLQEARYSGPPNA